MPAEAGSKMNAMRKRLTNHVEQCGGFVHNALRVKKVERQGATMRGLITTETLEAGTVIMKLPRACWIQKSTSESFSKKSIEELSACRGSAGAGAAADVMTWGAFLATERREGAASPLNAYLDSLPYMGYFKATLPLMAGPDVLKHYGAMPFFNQIYQAINSRKTCLEAWQIADEDVQALTFADVEHFSMVYNTRASDAGPETLLLPYADIINTDTEETQNVERSMQSNDNEEEKDEFTYKTTVEIEAGSEIISAFCNICSNKKMLFSWGVYLEGNPNRLTAQDMSSSSAPNAEDIKKAREFCRDKRLMNASLSLLEDASTSDVAVPDQTAPRCIKEIDGVQAPMRCLLSRVAWEFCGCVWEGRECPSVDEKPDDGTSEDDAEGETETLSDEDESEASETSREEM